MWRRFITINTVDLIGLSSSQTFTSAGILLVFPCLIANSLPCKTQRTKFINHAILHVEMKRVVGQWVVESPHQSFQLPPLVHRQCWCLAVLVLSPPHPLHHLHLLNPIPHLLLPSAPHVLERTFDVLNQIKKSSGWWSARWTRWRISSERSGKPIVFIASFTWATVNAAGCLPDCCIFSSTALSQLPRKLVKVTGRWDRR